MHYSLDGVYLNTLALCKMGGGCILDLLSCFFPSDNFYLHPSLYSTHSMQHVLKKEVVFIKLILNMLSPQPACGYMKKYTQVSHTYPFPSIPIYS